MHGGVALELIERSSDGTHCRLLFIPLFHHGKPHGEPLAILDVLISGPRLLAEPDTLVHRSAQHEHLSSDELELGWFQ